MDTIEKYKIMKPSVHGFTLIELIVVISILGIILAIAIPSYVSVISNTKERVCTTSRSQLEKNYEIKLQVEDVGHFDKLFEEFMIDYDNVCPMGGTITYFNNQMRCNFHDEDNENEVGEVPYL